MRTPPPTYSLSFSPLSPTSHFQTYRTSLFLSTWPIMRRPTSILVLPQELLDLVIDHFYDDLATLCHCALVARAWLQPAQTHLFRDIRLRHSIDIFTFRRLMTHRGYIARSVRTLRINAKIFKPRYYGNRPVESPYIDTIQGGIFTSLGQLRTLHFEDVYFDIFPLDCGLLDAIGKLPIHELKFSKCDFRNFETFERFVFANTRCTHLSLDDIKWKEAPDHTTFSESLIAHRAAFGLTHISLGSYCEIDLYSNWLAQTSALSTLRSLEMIGLTHMRDVKLAGDLLKRLAGTLQHLRLKCSFSCAYESQLVRIPHVINLAPLQKLYSLHLSPQGQANHQFSWASALLAQTTSPLLRKVTIDTYLVTDRQVLKLTEWERFVGLLAKTPRFSHVDQICIWYRGPMALDEAKALVKEDLAGLPEHRKVRVEDHAFRG